MSQQNTFGINGISCPTCMLWFHYRAMVKHQKKQCQKISQQTTLATRRSQLSYHTATPPTETMTTSATSGNVADMTSTMDDVDAPDGHHNTQPPVDRMGAIESTPSQDAVDDAMDDEEYNPDPQDDTEDEDNRKTEDQYDYREEQDDEQDAEQKEFSSKPSQDAVDDAMNDEE